MQIRVAANDAGGDPIISRRQGHVGRRDCAGATCCDVATATGAASAAPFLMEGIMISNCGHDERGKYSGGAAGDQTGTEWQIIAWYNRPWNCVLRHPDQRVRNDLAYLARAAAQNDNIGYDQGQRTTYWTQLAAVGYDPAKITAKCEADCSSGVAANVKAVGYRLGIKKLQQVSKDCYTGNLRAALKAAGFEVLTASKYLTSDKYLLPGDILLYEGHHTATNLDYGSEAKPAPVKSGWVQEDGGTRYYYEDGTGQCVRNDWWQAGDDWYWFDGAGKMVTDVWYEYDDGEGSRWYYLGPDGKMRTGLQDVDGKWYYLDEKGRMAIKPVTLTPDRNGALQYPGLAQ